MNMKKQFAFNAPNIDGILALIEIRKAAGYNFIIQVSEKLVKIYGWETINSITKKNKSMWFSLDHCRNLDNISKCQKKNGWTSALFDASEKPIKDNIALCKKALKICRKNKILLECEIGALKLGNYTDISYLKRFLSNVDCDLIGIAIGTQHGKYVGTKVNLDLIKAASQFNKPLVVHGASGIDNIMLKKLFDCGAYKINISTSLKDIYKAVVSKTKSYDALDIQNELKEKFANYIGAKMSVLK